MGATVRKRGSKWWVFVHHKGRRKAVPVGERRAAQAVAEQIQARLALGDLAPLSNGTGGLSKATVTLKEYAEQWLTREAQVRCKASTLDLYRQQLANHILPSFGPLSLSEITRERVKTFLADRIANGLNPSTVQSLLIPLRAILYAAVENGAIPSNPAARMGRFVRPLQRQSAERINPFTRPEIIELLRVADARMPDWYPLVLCAARAGLRRGELLGLQWSDFDFERRLIFVRRQYYRRQVTTPKNGKVRLVDMSAQLTRVLLIFKARKEGEASAVGRSLSPWVFPNSTGQNPVQGSWLGTRVWKPLLLAAGLRHRGVHQIRHTYASLLLADGQSLAYVRDQLGHHSIKITVDTYGHLVPGENKAAVDRLDDVLEAPTRNACATVPSSLPVVSSL